MTDEEIAELQFKQSMMRELEDGGDAGMRVTPHNVVAVADLIQDDIAHPFLNRFGYLCIRST
jgi:hypothetical protein